MKPGAMEGARRAREKRPTMPQEFRAVAHWDHHTQHYAASETLLCMADTRRAVANRCTRNLPSKSRRHLVDFIAIERWDAKRGEYQLIGVIPELTASRKIEWIDDEPPPQARPRRRRSPDVVAFVQPRALRKAA